MLINRINTRSVWQKFLIDRSNIEVCGNPYALWQKVLINRIKYKGCAETRVLSILIEYNTESDNIE
jgi:hypothetical protein